MFSRSTTWWTQTDPIPTRHAIQGECLSIVACFQLLGCGSDMCVIVNFSYILRPQFIPPPFLDVEDELDDLLGRVGLLAVAGLQGGQKLVECGKRMLVGALMGGRGTEQIGVNEKVEAFEQLIERGSTTRRRAGVRGRGSGGEQSNGGDVARVRGG